MKTGGGILAALGIIGLVTGIVRMIDAFGQPAATAAELAVQVNQSLLMIGLASAAMIVGAGILIFAFVNRMKSDGMAEEAVLNGAATHRSKG